MTSFVFYLSFPYSFSSSVLSNSLTTASCTKSLNSFSKDIFTRKILSLVVPRGLHFEKKDWTFYFQFLKDNIISLTQELLSKYLGNFMVKVKRKKKAIVCYSFEPSLSVLGSSLRQLSHFQDVGTEYDLTIQE